MKRYESTKSVCPHYKHENRFVIFCEGICEGSVTHVAFAKPSECYKHKEKHCRKDYQKCPITKVLEAKGEA